MSETVTITKSVTKDAKSKPKHSTQKTKAPTSPERVSQNQEETLQESQVQDDAVSGSEDEAHLMDEGGGKKKKPRKARKQTPIHIKQNYNDETFHNFLGPDNILLQTGRASPKSLRDLKKFTKQLHKIYHYRRRGGSAFRNRGPQIFVVNKCETFKGKISKDYPKHLLPFNFSKKIRMKPSTTALMGMYVKDNMKTILGSAKRFLDMANKKKLTPVILRETMQTFSDTKKLEKEFPLCIKAKKEWVFKPSVPKKPPATTQVPKHTEGRPF